MGDKDYAYAGKGNDLLHAHPSHDVQGTNISSGGEGDDNILGGYGADWIDGGKGGNVRNDRSGAGRPADVGLVDGGSGANSVDVFDGDALDVVCNGGFVQAPAPA